MFIDRSRSLFLIGSVAFIIFTIYFINNHEKIIWESSDVYIQIKSLRSNITTAARPAPKTILLSTKYFGGSWYSKEFLLLLESDGTACEYSNCILTTDMRKANESDAMLFHARDLPNSVKLRADRKRYPRPIWIWVYAESPVNTYRNFESYNGLFDWTDTYSSRSDINVPLFGFFPLKDERDRPPKAKDFTTGKTKLVMSAMSNCLGSRISIVKEIKKYIQFDLYGNCGKNINPRIKNCARRDHTRCQKLFQDYKFYFAMENSYCSEYVTEKFYANGLQNGLVPVVLGGGDYKKVGPPNSFINVLDFKDMESLANYLKYLNKNHTAYNEYHQWRYEYKVRRYNRMCEVCKALWEREEQYVSSRYNKTSVLRLNQFWSKKSCRGWSNVLSRYLGK